MEKSENLVLNLSDAQKIYLEHFLSHQIPKLQASEATFFYDKIALPDNEVNQKLLKELLQQLDGEPHSNE